MFMWRSFTFTGRSIWIFPSTSRGLESVPTPSQSAEVVCLSIFPREEIYFVVTHVSRHQRTSKYRGLQTPTYRCLCIVFSGVIHAWSSEIGINGYSRFKNNSAWGFGGEAELSSL